MSYDLYMAIDTGGEYPATVAEVGNYTSNVVGIWFSALGEPLADFHGRTGREAIPKLERAVAWLYDADNLKAMRAVEPENGWGDAVGARSYLEGLLQACREHPKALIRVSR